MFHSRERRYAFIFLLLALNALMTLAGAAVLDYGWLAAGLNLFNISAIAWLALAAGIALVWQADPGSSPSPGDHLAFGAAVVAALVPVPALSAAILTVVASWAVWSSTPGSALRRAGLILLSLTALLLWGRVFLAWGAGPLLAADARFVGLLADTRTAGNAVHFADGTKFVIAPGCSSLHGISLALILWTTVVQYFAVRLTPQVWATLVMTLAASVAANGLRLAVIAWNPHDFDYWHTGNGGMLFGWVTMGVIVAVAYAGLGRAPRLA